MEVLIRITLSWLGIFVLQKVQRTLAEPTLVSNSSKILENGTFTMECITNESFTTWVRNSNDTDAAVIGFYGDNCIATSFIKYQPQIFDYSCYSNVTSNMRTYRLILKNVKRHQNDDTWQCEAGLSDTKSSAVVLHVIVPVTYATITGVNNASVFTTQENISNSFTCITSYSRPAANITWYITDGLRENNQHVFGNINFTQESKLDSTISNIELNLNWTYNGWILVCNAKNIPHYMGVFHNVTFNITYSTSKPNVSHCTKGELYKVIQNTKGKLTCTANGGNPVGTLHWNCTGNVTEYRGPHNSVTQTVVWNATQSQYCTCTSTNIAGARSTTVNTELLFPPLIEELQNRTVFEGDHVALQCYVIRANPRVHIIRWTSNKHSVSNATLSLTNVSRSDDMVYKCTANNSMYPSCQDDVNGSTSKSLHVDVLYPPYVNITPGKTFTVKEGDRFNYTCPVVFGNPPSTTITWRRSTDTKIWSSSELLIHTVTRLDDYIYICYATYRMDHSNGTINMGSVSANIRLKVNFQTNVTDFYIRGYEQYTSVIVIENTSLIFECHLQSSPTADARIFQTETLVNSSKANELFYNTTAYCSSGPVNYSCHGNNLLNIKSSTRLIEVFVNCKPRVDINADVQFYATSAINQTVTLSYTALAYPLPSFVWYRNGSPINTRDARLTIYSTDLLTNLTITKLEESDFGEYTLIVSNDVGSINESFHMIPDGVPEEPTHLTQIASNTTISAIALNWRSGFKNGSEQIFVVMYRQQSEENWHSVNVHDTGPTGTTIHYNISRLSSGTSYDIVLFAVNAKGRSTSNATLTCSTKRIEPIDDTTDRSPIIGAAVGSAVGLLVLGVVIAGVVIFRRRFIKQPDCPTIQPQIPVTYENLKINQIPNKSIDYHMGTAKHRTLETNVDRTYEGLSQEGSGKENEYTCLGNQSGDGKYLITNITS